LYEIGFGAQLKNEEVKSWDWVQELLEHKLKLIQEEAGATDLLLFFTNTKRINKLLNRERVRQEQPVKEYIPNFREAIAVQKEYKGDRKAEKPYHFYNLLAHMLSNYPHYVGESGLEADDYMCIRQYNTWRDKDTIICSRDKDLRQCPGLHYSWEMGKQAAIGPLFVEPLGFLEKRNEGQKYANGKPKPISLFGTGHKFFYAQMLMGDKVDSIGGVEGRGPAFAYNLLHEAETERECYELVAEIYVKSYGDDWKVRMKEQADLLHMVRELNEDGSPKLWLPPRREQ